MAVIPLTLIISLCLVFTFVVFFLREYTRHRFSSAESEALLPLAEEQPRTPGVIVLDLKGQEPRTRRRPCGRAHSDPEHRRCDGCTSHD